VETVDPQQCLSAALPPSQDECEATTLSCVCASDADCATLMGTNSQCVRASTGGQSCACKDGWLGPTCAIPALQAASSGDASRCAARGGVVDVVGVCCESTMVVNGTGHCCGAGFTTVDAAGACCESDTHVDACGVCGGTGVAVDALGECCTSSLPPSGICCVDAAGGPGVVDECGVCGGVNACGAAVTLRVSSAGLSTLNATTSALIVSTLAGQLGVAPSTIGNVTMSSGVGTGDATLRRALEAPRDRLLPVSVACDV
jgi:hypothetical protein